MEYLYVLRNTYTIRHLVVRRFHFNQSNIQTRGVFLVVAGRMCTQAYVGYCRFVRVVLFNLSRDFFWSCGTVQQATWRHLEFVPVFIGLASLLG